MYPRGVVYKVEGMEGRVYSGGRRYKLCSPLEIYRVVELVNQTVGVVL